MARKGHTVNLRLSLPASEALQRLRDATEREVLPFVAGPPHPSPKEFVFRTQDNRFRLWKAPSRSRLSKSVFVSVLSGQLVETANGSELVGSFSLHPFTRVVPYLPLLFIVVATVSLFQTGKFIEPSARLIAIMVVGVCIVAATLWDRKRFEQMDKHATLEFLRQLFPGASAHESEN